MKKSERLASMMIYLNGKKYFNLKDLMSEYHISKSTALRDIESLEEIGMPIYSEYGRYGRYGMLDNELLSPIVFSIDEVYALYFSMMNLENYKSIPFDTDVKTLKSKFEACLSKEYISKIDKMKSVFRFSNKKNVLESKYLKEIVLAAISESIVEITYVKDTTVTSYQVQLFEIESAFGQWYVSGYDDNQKFKVFRCDRILDLKHREDTTHLDVKQLQDMYLQNMKKEDAVHFEVGLSEKGMNIFYKENYPSMKLDEATGCLTGFYNRGEEDFIANYLLQFGLEITYVSPKSLKDLIIQKAKNIENHLTNLKE